MDEVHACADCGQPLDDGAWGGLCSKCLLNLQLQEHGPGTPDNVWSPPSPDYLASQFPELDIQEMIARGGMGAVYKARQKSLDRLVALKILPPTMAAVTGFTERFSREAQAMARLNHAHIVVIHDFGNRNGLCFFIMEFVDGLSLRALMEGGGIKPGEALKIVPQICEALQYAHEHGVVHRDIKPENILLDRQGSIKITDFGLARLVGSKFPGVAANSKNVVGTPGYMAPEQIEHPDQTDHRADIYSLGVVFYQLLTGELPLGRFPPPSRKVQIDVRLDEVVLRSLEKDPSLRYQQAAEVRSDVETIVASPGAAAGGQAASRSGATSRHWWPVPFTAGLSVVLGGCIIIAVVVLSFYLYGARVGAPGTYASHTLRMKAVAPAGAPSALSRSLDTYSARIIRSRLGLLCLLPHSWLHAHALALFGANLVVGGRGRTGANLAELDLDRGRWRDCSDLLPAYWYSVKRAVCSGHRVLLVGGSKPEPGGFGVKPRPVAGILNLADDHFRDLTSQMRLADSDPYILGVGGAACIGRRFLIGGAGGATFLEEFRLGPAGGFANLATAVPYYFATNNIIALGDNFLIDGGGAGPGGEPGTPAALGLISRAGQFTNLTGFLPTGTGVMGCSAFDGKDCLLQSFNTVDAQGMLELFDPVDDRFRNVTELFPKALSVQSISGDEGRFLVGGLCGPGAFLGIFRPRGGAVQNITSELPPGSRTSGTVDFDGRRIIVSGQTAQDRTFVSVFRSGAALSATP